MWVCVCVFFLYFVGHLKACLLAFIDKLTHFHSYSPSLSLSLTRSASFSLQYNTRYALNYVQYFVQDSKYSQFFRSRWLVVLLLLKSSSIWNFNKIRQKYGKKNYALTHTASFASTRTRTHYIHSLYGYYLINFNCTTFFFFSLASKWEMKSLLFTFHFTTPHSELNSMR